MADVKRAQVVRGVYVRGVAKVEGAILDVVAQPKSSDEITPGEYAELKAYNYLVEAPKTVVEKVKEAVSSATTTKKKGADE